MIVKSVKFTGLMLLAGVVQFTAAQAEAQVMTDSAGSAETADSAETSAQLRKTVSAGVRYLLERGQDREDGSYSKQLGPAVTAMCTRALLDNGIPVTHPQVQQSLKFLEAAVKPDGGIYAKDSTLKNYETSVSLMCFAKANAGWEIRRNDPKRGNLSQGFAVGRGRRP